jgi:hypothetical protein
MFYRLYFMSWQSYAKVNLTFDFFALIDAGDSSRRLPDLRFYHVGGKDKIVSIVSALKSLDMPV